MGNNGRSVSLGDVVSRLPQDEGNALLPTRNAGLGLLPAEAKNSHLAARRTHEPGRVTVGDHGHRARTAAYAAPRTAMVVAGTAAKGTRRRFLAKHAICSARRQHQTALAVRPRVPVAGLTSRCGWPGREMATAWGKYAPAIARWES